MVVPFNDLARAVQVQHAGLVAATEDVLASGWFVNGPQVRGFEREFAAYLGVPHVRGVASGTDALEIALRALQRDDRRTVVTAANAGGYTTCAARAAGLTVRFADVDPDTHCLTAAEVERSIDGDTFAVVVTHLYGRLADVDAIRMACQQLGVAVVEDCAQSAGARSSGGRAGSLADIATFSFYPTKNLGALGDGGAVATSQPDLADKVARLAQYGWGAKYQQVLGGGRNSRLDEIQAAYLRTRLPHLDTWNAARRAIVARYARAASSRIRVLPAGDESHAAHLAVVVTDDAGDLAHHLEEAGIRTEVHYPIPDDLQPYRVGTDPALLPVTHSLVGRILSLPCFPELSDAEVVQVCDALAAY